MHLFVSPSGSVPGYLLQIAEVMLGNKLVLEQCFLDLFLNSPDPFIFLGPTEVDAVIAYDHCDPCFMVGQRRLFLFFDYDGSYFSVQCVFKLSDLRFELINCDFRVSFHY